MDPEPSQSTSGGESGPMPEPRPGQDATPAGPVRRRRWPWLVLAVVLVAILGLGGWLAARVLTVRDDLTAARGAIAGLGDGEDLRQGVETIASHARSAAQAANDPVWRLAEHLPWIGDNLIAVRLSSEALDALTTGLAVPVLDAFGSGGDGPVLGRVLPLLTQASGRVSELNAAVGAVRGDPGLLGEVRAGVDQVGDVLGTADPVLSILPGMLGADGVRNYLMVAQSNAEVLALGGSAASQTLIRFDHGEVKIVKQADSGDYQRGVPADVEIDQSAIDLYNEYLVTYVNTSVGRPDWPTAARTIRALWGRDIDDTEIDGLISVDPLALARVMRATGPVTVDGRELTSENIVDFVLSQVYTLASPAEVAETSDEVFKQVALAVFDRLAKGEFDPVVLLSAVEQSIQTGSLMFYSTDPALQERIAPLRIAGILPTTNDETTTIGVFYRDASLGSKKDYYLHSDTEVVSRCTADGGMEYTVSVTVWLDLTRQQAEKLPRYVLGGDLADKTFRTQVFIYGPPGTTVTGEERDKDLTWNWRPLDMTDLGRPTPSFMTINPLGGEKARVSVTFTGPPGQYGPLEVRTTPIVNPTKVTLDEQACPR